MHLPVRRGEVNGHGERDLPARAQIVDKVGILDHTEVIEVQNAGELAFLDVRQCELGLLTQLSHGRDRTAHLRVIRHDSETNRYVLIRVAELLQLDLDFLEADVSLALLGLRAEASRELGLVAHSRPLNFIDGLPVEVQHAEARGRLVPQPGRRNLERDLVI